MNEPSFAKQSVSQQLTVMRIIAGALIAGVGLFLAFVLSRNPFAQPPTGQQMSLMAVGFAAINTILQFGVPFVIRSGQQMGPANTVEQRAAAIFFTRMLIRLALLEGAAFFNIIALMQEGNSWTLVVIGVLLLIMLSLWPTRTRFEQFIENARLEEALRAPD
jgi:TRAP-type C4-dicarboxylate transport system permease large subunit